ncbi:MAG TPA: hypothetical protein VE136_03665 [Anaerolineales bacterium]|nr:hypothetical protein [Anaerolineales bacterium]
MNAQTEPPPAAPEATWTGEVTGIIVNRSPGSEVPDKVDVMLHAWDQRQGEKFMLHGESTSEGDFRFEEVSFEPGLIYAVMADYEEAMYYSEPYQVKEGETSFDLEVPIYESNNDLSQVKVDQMHVLFYFAQGGLAVSEVYVLSNSGDYTVKDAVDLEDGTKATLQLPLPEEAANLYFEGDPGGRYVQIEGGFADTAPLVPGYANTQIMLAYVLPYEDAFTYTYAAPLEIVSLSFLYPEDGGINLKGEGLTPAGSWPMGNGGNFGVLSHPVLQPGETVQLNISGEPLAAPASMLATGSVEEPAKKSTNLGLGIGGIVLGLALVGVGVWWWRKPQEDELEDVEAGEEEAAFEHTLTEIALLDEAFERGEIPEEGYRDQRARLIRQVKGDLQSESAG